VKVLPGEPQNSGTSQGGRSKNSRENIFETDEGIVDEISRPYSAITIMEHSVLPTLAWLGLALATPAMAQPAAPSPLMAQLKA